MIDVIQIFKSVDIIGKQDYDTASRQGFGDWGPIVSKKGFLKEGTLTLPVECENFPVFDDPDLIVIQDLKNFNELPMSQSVHDLPFPSWFKNSRMAYVNLVNRQPMAFNILSKPWVFEIFELRKIGIDCIEVWLNYSRDFIGIPKRENHKIAELKVGKPIRFRINGKDDFTLSGTRQQRKFTEFDYILEYKGKADKMEFRVLNKIETTKTAPVSDCKVIDERKILS